MAISFLDKMNLSHDKNSDNLTGKEVSEKNNHGIFTGYYTTLITNWYSSIAVYSERSIIF